MWVDMELKLQKTEIVYCKDSNRGGDCPGAEYDFLGLYVLAPERKKTAGEDSSLYLLLQSATAQ